jgi:hypothetical protein
MKTIVGSTSERVMRKALCPILIIPERFKEIVSKPDNLLTLSFEAIIPGVGIENFSTKGGMNL